MLRSLGSWISHWQVRLATDGTFAFVSIMHVVLMYFSRPGACLVVSGPGLIHALGGMANANMNCWYDSTPALHL